MPRSTYEAGVFINCPFDSDYVDIFRAIVFAVQDCRFVARCALEATDSSETRIGRIIQIISECRWGVHDISRTELDGTHGLPRFNMPLELGLFLGAKSYGSAEQREKRCLVLDREIYRYQKFCSDISGQDIRAHSNRPETAIRHVRDWLRDVDRGTRLPGGTTIHRRFLAFNEDLPVFCSTFHLNAEELTFNDLTTLVDEWLKVNTL